LEPIRQIPELKCHVQLKLPRKAISDERYKSGPDSFTRSVKAAGEIAPIWAY
jgi:hypothetical protein